MKRTTREKLEAILNEDKKDLDEAWGRKVEIYVLGPDDKILASIGVMEHRTPRSIKSFERELDDFVGNFKAARRKHGDDLVVISNV